MNFFNQYGIKEVADVVFYSITRIGDEEFYTPVLAFDTLKISSLSKSSDTIISKGGKGNASILGWSYIKDVKVKLEDALFSQASLDLYMNGRFLTKHSAYMSLIMKLNVANKYGRLNYHPLAKPSPKLTHEEEQILFAAAQEAEIQAKTATYVYVYGDNNEYVAENRKILLESYYKRNFSGNDKAMPQIVIKTILDKIDSLRKINSFDNDVYKSQAIDRMEKCIVKNKNGLTISAAAQRENLLKYYSDEKSNFTIYYDIKTMQPFFGLNSDLNFNTESFTLKQGTVFYKFTRTIDLIEVPNMLIGTDLTINPETFPGEYKIVGESYVRGRDGKDHRMQLIFNRAAIAPTTNIELKADGGPSTFSIDVNILKPKNNTDMVILRQYKVEDDEFYGGTRIVPQSSKHSYSTVVDNKIEEVESNDEFY